ncbi:ergothioneine biosynthesis protein EgtB [Ramlibacter sp. AW1]|uniref:Ergothioneine biosynthesis protein EgtB n=1 Tax=Ramlibacter aurantiacus TaxID=2801330 RepID=A0A936ZHK8_9BURK|nr:ergothioneine biosynthesis protein EgtB [Ramlibacter aurantiacus]MBL0420002.1 ergothioneine biosynthesis protein EgtB [Ramlibacter aurantiacus]
MPARLPTTRTGAALPREALADRLQNVRAWTLGLTAPLSAEDQCVQSMPDASPAKWHLAHTSWFFEAMVLVPHLPGYQPCDPRFFHLFNSYYEALGTRHPRPQRGLITRPDLATVHAYRAHVDRALEGFIAAGDAAAWEAAAGLVELGLHHEQQHQELIVTDMLHALSCNPLFPAYGAGVPLPPAPSSSSRSPLHWLRVDGGVRSIGHGGAGFAFDNEGPRHEVLLRPFELAHRLVTCGEWLAFIEDGGYARPTLWLSDGWAQVQAQGWRAPAYWTGGPGDGWQVFGLKGLRPLDLAAPVMHLSFFEAAAFAEWSGARLPTEFEWEAAHGTPGLEQMTGTAWQWTRSSYDPYPGFRTPEGAVGEYNGKFMIGQVVLRGSSFATPSGHARPTYRNFFPPAARWQFTGLRLAREVS